MSVPIGKCACSIEQDQTCKLSLGLQLTLLRANLTETTNAATSGPNPKDPGQDTIEEGLAANRSVIAHANNNNNRVDWQQTAADDAHRRRLLRQQSAPMKCLPIAYEYAQGLGTVENHGNTEAVFSVFFFFKLSCFVAAVSKGVMFAQ